MRSNPGYSVRLEGFEGPLDLLLHLIRGRKLNIWDIPIAEVTGQYLQHLALMEALDLEIGGEFVVMAATLMEIKSRLLLPKPEEPAAEDEGQDPREELVRRLLEYEQFQQAAEELRALEQQAARTFPRPGAETWRGAIPLVELKPADLLQALRRLKPAGEELRLAAPPAVVRREPLSLETQIAAVLQAVEADEAELVPLSQLLEYRVAVPPRTALVVLFLAVLELMRQGRISAWQVMPRGEILLSRPRLPAH
ncbi:MAG: segregation/condensation protein A [Armatimonadetes bacterium]|nr:segregation/condensation protein A [Armatimonadota bacterium]